MNLSFTVAAIIKSPSTFIHSPSLLCISAAFGSVVSRGEESGADTDPDAEADADADADTDADKLPPVLLAPDRDALFASAC